MTDTKAILYNKDRASVILWRITIYHFITSVLLHTYSIVCSMFNRAHNDVLRSILINILEAC